MISSGIVLFVAMYLLVLHFYLLDERRHAQTHCRPHHWRLAGNCWTCDVCSLRLKAN